MNLKILYLLLLLAPTSYAAPFSNEIASTSNSSYDREAMLTLDQAAFDQEVASTSRTQIAVVDSDLFLLGTFDSYTADTVIRELESNADIERVVFTANGGSIDDRDTLRLGRYIRAQELHTHLIADGVAASGGVSLFLAGIERSVGAGAFLGVHAWAQCSRHDSGYQCRPATDFSQDDEAHDLHRDYIVEMLGDDAFYWFSINSAAHNSIHWLADEELHRFQVVNSDVAISPSIPFKEAFTAEYERTCHNCPE